MSKDKIEFEYGVGGEFEDPLQEEEKSQEIKKKFSILNTKTIIGSMLLLVLIYFVFRGCGSGTDYYYDITDSLQTNVEPIPTNQNPLTEEQKTSVKEITSVEETSPVDVYTSLVHVRHEGNTSVVNNTVTLRNNIVEVSIPSQDVLLRSGLNKAVMIFKGDSLSYLEIDGYQLSSKPFEAKPLTQEKVYSRRIVFYTIKRGDTLSSILKRFKMTRRELHSLQPQLNLLHGDYLVAGTKLKVYVYE